MQAKINPKNMKKKNHILHWLLTAQEILRRIKRGCKLKETFFLPKLEIEADLRPEIEVNACSKNSTHSKLINKNKTIKKNCNFVRYQSFFKKFQAKTSKRALLMCTGC